MSWTKKKILSPLPEELEGIVSSLNGTVNTVQKVLGPLALALESASILFVLGNDLFAAIMDLVITAIEDLVNDTEIYALPFARFAMGLIDWISGNLDPDYHNQLDDLTRIFLRDHIPPAIAAEINRSDPAQP